MATIGIDNQNLRSLLGFVEINQYEDSFYHNGKQIFTSNDLVHMAVFTTLFQDVIVSDFFGAGMIRSVLNFGRRHIAPILRNNFNIDLPDRLVAASVTQNEEPSAATIYRGYLPNILKKRAIQAGLLALAFTVSQLALSIILIVLVEVFLFNTPKCVVDLLDGKTELQFDRDTSHEEILRTLSEAR